ncbi:exported hypothetical protein [Candidatus Sulfopaludibacter sp. SbA3]|nr:exported hypothetical protein [Candidatus Sulfopaludibacter sp. SbA3]
MGDLRYALRILLKAPGFTFVAIVSLAIGVGANTAIFSLLNAVALRPLATTAPDRLVGLATVDGAGHRAGFSYSNFEQIRSHQRTLSGMFAWQDLSVFTLEAEGSLFPGTALLASQDFSAAMPIHPVIGRSITPEDGSVAVLGYACWQRYFRASPTALGKLIRIQGKPFTVVGVAPRSFTDMEGAGAVDAIVPLGAFTSLDRQRQSRVPSWEVTGRRRNGLQLCAHALRLSAQAAARHGGSTAVVGNGQPGHLAAGTRRSQAAGNRHSPGAGGGTRPDSAPVSDGEYAAGYRRRCGRRVLRALGHRLPRAIRLDRQHRSRARCIGGWHCLCVHPGDRHSQRPSLRRRASMAGTRDRPLRSLAARRPRTDRPGWTRRKTDGRDSGSALAGAGSGRGTVHPNSAESPHAAAGIPCSQRARDAAHESARRLHGHGSELLLSGAVPAALASARGRSGILRDPPAGAPGSISRSLRHCQ